MDLTHWVKTRHSGIQTAGQILVEYWRHPERLECVKKPDGSPCSTAESCGARGFAKRIG